MSEDRAWTVARHAAGGVVIATAGVMLLAADGWQWVTAGALSAAFGTAVGLWRTRPPHRPWATRLGPPG